MVTGSPIRLAARLPLLMLLALAHSLTVGSQPARTNTQRTFQADLHSPQSAICRNASGSLAHASQPQRTRHSSTVAVSAAAAFSLPDGWYQLGVVEERGIVRHVPAGTGRSPPSFLL